MGILKLLSVILILGIILLFVFYPTETKAMLSTVGNVILDFGKERAHDIQGTVAQKIG